jgi:hypothetical protein
MKPFINHSIKLVLPTLFLFTAIVSNAQEPSRLRLDRLNQLEDRADTVVEVNVDGKLLDLAKRVLEKIKDKDARKVGVAIAELRGIYVKICNFEKDNEYNAADFDYIRSQLQAPGWERMVGVRSKNKQNVEVFTMFTGEKISGVAVIISDSKTLGVVNVVGPIDIELLIELSGHMNIPKLDIDVEKEKPELKEKKNEDKNDDENIKISVKTEVKEKVQTKKP